MKIALDHEIWQRLYGPYGNRNVNQILHDLRREWDADTANELFWEELHHQDTIYPVTFAALPWLVELAPDERSKGEEFWLFFSHVIYCAVARFGATSTNENFRGLSTSLEDHHHSWLPENERLNSFDLEILKQLEKWFEAHAEAFALRCLTLVDGDLQQSAYAIEGYISLLGSDRIAWAIIMFSDGHPMNEIVQEQGALDDNDNVALSKLLPHITERNPQIAEFIVSYPGCQISSD